MTLRLINPKKYKGWDDHLDLPSMRRERYGDWRDNIGVMPDYELRHMTIDPPPPPPRIDLIFVLASEQGGIVDSTCKRFASDFHFRYLSISEGLSDILRAEPEKMRQALEPLHPQAFQYMLQSGKRVPAAFLVTILHRGIEAEVAKGNRRIMIAGLGEDLEGLTKFAEEVASPSAVFSFQCRGEDGEKQQAAIVKVFDRKVLPVPCGANPDETYNSLHAAIIERGNSKGSAGDTDVEMGNIVRSASDSTDNRNRAWEL